MKIHKMSISRVNTLKLSYQYYLMLFLCIMFSFSAILSLYALTNDLDKCNCSKEKTLYTTYTSKKLISSMHKLAILVPYKERFEELMEFAPYMYNFLNRQKVNFDIIILNQVDQYRFNRASLINAGFLEVRANYDYIAMHDVDLLPLNPQLLYSYPEQPIHLAAPTLHPRYHYEKFIGGILLINKKQFELVNGLSNRYWGWGLEDDEFYVRLRDAHINITRPVNITTGIDGTFRHVHGKERKRDTVKCYNQREVTRRRDRQTGLHDVNYTVLSNINMEIQGAPLIVINIRLFCNYSATPWCDCSKSTEFSVKQKKSSE
ncbi:xylosylprotein 4-beta-galactosyltransferase isoform X1 [Diorhabda carinulata]|uniref:xylosylprotein 4-beta-galactosyltransferase isoform X1 n=1 Tax=Diorhabda carinulata TaxID=1163345 RepID=UPI0025A2CFB6|nr:xylosylprotein 4-beta-galactosyltransferase isoform X1 [Diorhabda carinulata]XP_057655177.1 xylosylprotein 4-beta-galactosyltransferase isoform X1 [Diorhabda carinulata]XP_057655178.1 xylosylprotein 4-beta-galactosyltransferase isoform X1 [Diorhabda carinulata]